MITEFEREVINLFNELSLVNTTDAKLQLYKTINENLEKFLGQSDNFNFKNYCKQINYDLRNFYSTSMFFEITKFFSLLKSRILSLRYSIKVSPGKDVILILIDNLKNTLDNNMRLNNDVEFIERFCDLFIDRKMAPEILLKAEDQFYKLAKEIFQTKKYTCYTPIVTVLSKLEKSRADLNGAPLTDDEVKLSLWFETILDQLFETKEENMLNEILSSFDFMLPIMTTLNYRNTSFWPAVKTKIIDTYSEKLGDMRGWYTNWYKIWNLLIRIVNIEILRSASVINKFLSIVELGFRNDNLKIRAQAHLCWKNLIEIFAMSNELNVPKRIKLLCIPFKSGKMRAADIAINKFKAWWYLITQLKHNIMEHVDTILVPFLEYSFGKYSSVPFEWYYDKESFGPGVLVPVSKYYISLRMPSIISFIYLFGKPNKITETMRVKCDMDPLTEKLDFSRHTSGIFGKSLINYCAEATVLVCLLPSQQNQIMFLQLLWNGALEQIANENTYENFESIMTNIDGFVKIGQIKLTENSSLPKFIGEIFRIIMDANVYPFKEVDGCYNHGDILKALQALQNFFLNDNAGYFTSSKVISKIYSELNQYKSPKLIYDFVKDFATSTAEIGNNDHRINIRLEMWDALTKSILNDLNDNTYDKNNTAIVDFLNYLIKLKNVDVEASIVTSWKQIYTKCLIQNIDFNEVLMKTLKAEVEAAPKDDLKYLINFLIIILNSNLDNLQSKIVQILGLYDVILEKIVEYAADVCDYDANSLIQLLSTIIVKFDLYCFLKPQIIKDLKSIIQLFKKLQSKNVKYKKVINDNFMKLKQNIITKLKPEMNNNIIKELLKLCDDDFQRGNINNNISLNSSNAFVVIPSVWSLKPETLTDHQVEKMKERKDDIPAMYCDLSQSQDSMSIKPWTPKKIGCTEERITAVEDATKDHKENDKQNLSFTNQVKSNDIIDASQIEPPPPSMRIATRRSSLRSHNNSGETSNCSTLLVEPSPKSPDSPKKIRLSPKKKVATTNEKEQEPNEINKYVCELMKGSDSPKKLVIKVNRPNNEEVANENPKFDEIQLDTPPQDTPPKDTPSKDTPSKDTPPQDVSLHDLPAQNILSNDIQPEIEMDTEPNTSILNDENFAEKITNKSIRSSPELSDTEEREKDLINSTLELSPITYDEKQIEFNNFVKTPPATFSGSGALNSPSSSMLNSSLTNNKFLIRRTPRDILAQSKSATLYSSSSPNSSTTVNSRYHRGKHLMSLIAAQKQTVVSCSPEQKKKDEKGPVLLTFSKRLPPSDASPSISILKRKLIEDSINESESPAFKRKRVSFHDPPVSATKEYVADDNNKIKNPVKRCLIESPLNSKLIISEVKAGSSSSGGAGGITIDNFVIDDDDDFDDDVQEISSVAGSSFSGMTTLRIDGSATTIDVDDVDDISITPSPSITFANDEAVLQYVLEKYSISELKEKSAIYRPCTTREEFLPRYGAIVHELTSIINNDDNSKVKLLEYLAENYSKEFLQFALQENSSKTVCDLLNYQYLLEYIMTNRLNNNETKEQFNKSFIQNFHTLSDELLAIIKNNLTNDSATSEILLVKLFKIIENLYELRSYNNLHKNKNEMDDCLFNHLFKLFSNKLSKEQVLECIKEKL